MTLTPTDELAGTIARPHVTVLSDRCAGCQECVVRCPPGALAMDAARWVVTADDGLCVGCRQCERTCPFGAITVAGPLVVAARTEPAAAHPYPLAGDLSEVRPGFGSWQQALAEAGRCLACPDPTCVRGCPAHNDIPSFIGAIRDGDLARAHQVLRLTSVLPDVCSRVCDQSSQCEGACSWALAGGAPVAIGRLERFVADHHPVPPPARAARDAAGGGLSVAVVGAGPAGIAATWELVEAGASVTVYEKDPEPGGLTGWGIPDFTLPAGVAERPWRQLVAAGVVLRCGQEIRAEDIDRLRAEHDAVILAHGASVPLRLPVPGADLAGVTDATSFLKAGKAALEHGNVAGLLQTYGISERTRDDGGAPLVLVLGAGNTAMDVARTARRLGLRAVCVDWFDERFAMARQDELEEARREGVDVRFLRTVTRIEGQSGRARRAVLARTRQTRAGRRPKVLGGSQEELAVDLVVMAMGYRIDPALAAALPGTPAPRAVPALPDRRWLASGVLAAPPIPSGRRKPVGEVALGREAALAAVTMPVQDRVWVAGDALVGPSTVVEAMAHGRRAAAAVVATRPRRGPQPAPRRVLVGYEGRDARTARAAGLIAESLRATGAVVRAVPLAHVDLAELRAIDLLVIGARAEPPGLARFRAARAARVTRAWLAGLPRLAGLRAATFCTFTGSPAAAAAAAAAAAGIRRALEDRGAIVLADGAFGTGNGFAEVDRFAQRLRAAAWPPPEQTTPTSARGR